MLFIKILILLQKVQENEKQIIICGLVVPARYTGYTKYKETERILNTELRKRKELFSHFEFLIEEHIWFRFPFLSQILLMVKKNI